MPVQPDKKLEQIIFAEQHWPVWQANLVALGLGAETVTQIKTATEDARKDYDAALAKRLEAKAATLTADNSIGDMKSLVADAIKAIRLRAEQTNDPNVYAIAQIPAPQPPQAALPPTKPTGVTFTIQPSGALALGWSNAASTPGFDASTVNVIYTVRRRINNQTAFSIVGAVPAARAGRRGLTTFTDDTLPAGASNIQYMIVPQRGTLTGPTSDVYAVMLGVSGSGGGSGGLAVTSTPAPADIKLAA